VPALTKRKAGVLGAKERRARVIGSGRDVGERNSRCQAVILDRHLLRFRLARSTMMLDLTREERLHHDGAKAGYIEKRSDVVI
jgi:hypothetical protein